MDKEKISKELLQGVEHEKRKETVDNKISESPQERLRRKRTTHYIEDSSNSESHEVSTKNKKSKMSTDTDRRGSGRPRKSYKAESDSDSSYDGKDKSFTVRSSRPSKVSSGGKGRGRHRKMSSSSASSAEKSDADDKAYKPSSYRGKGVKQAKATRKSTGSNKKGRGRPKKSPKVKDVKEIGSEEKETTVKAAESEHASQDDNTSKRSQDGSFEAEQLKAADNEKKDVTDVKIPQEEHAGETVDDAKKKRGRPSAKEKAQSKSKGRGRPKKSAGENGVDKEVVTKSDSVVDEVSEEKNIPEGSSAAELAPEIVLPSEAPSTEITCATEVTPVTEVAPVDSAAEVVASMEGDTA